MLEPTSQAEVEAFEQWLETNPEHARLYAEFDGIAAVGERVPRRAFARTEKRVPSPPFRPGWVLAAVVLVAAVGGVWLVAHSSQPAQAAINNFGPSTRAVRLGDGTAVLLDTGAELTLGSARGEPAVTIRRGRARFSVTTRGSMPFSVAARGALVTASDGVFDVSLQQEETRVRVLKGEVVLAVEDSTAGARDIPLAAGEGAEVRDGQVLPAGQAPYDALWPAARVDFEDAPLSTVVGRANGIGKPRIEIAGADVGRLRVTGVMDLRDPRALARKLAATLDLHAEERGGAILLRR